TTAFHSTVAQRDCSDTWVVIQTPFPALPRVVLGQHVAISAVQSRGHCPVLLVGLLGRFTGALCGNRQRFSCRSCPLQLLNLLNECLRLRVLFKTGQNWPESLLQ